MWMVTEPAWTETTCHFLWVSLRRLHWRWVIHCLKRACGRNGNLLSPRSWTSSFHIRKQGSKFTTALLNSGCFHSLVHWSITVAQKNNRIYVLRCVPFCREFKCRCLISHHICPVIHYYVEFKSSTYFRPHTSVPRAESFWTLSFNSPTLKHTPPCFFPKGRLMPLCMKRFPRKKAGRIETSASLLTTEAHSWQCTGMFSSLSFSYAKVDQAVKNSTRKWDRCIFASIDS